MSRNLPEPRGGVWLAVIERAGSAVAAGRLTVYPRPIGTLVLLVHPREATGRRTVVLCHRARRSNENPGPARKPAASFFRLMAGPGQDGVSRRVRLTSDDECASPFSEDSGLRSGTSIIEEGAMRCCILLVWTCR